MKTVLITGASRGIGRATAEKFLDEGWFVIGTFLTEQGDLKHKNLTMIPLDISKSESVDSAVREIRNTGKEIGVLINNAGINVEEWEENILDLENLSETLAVNLFGTVGFTEKLLTEFKHIQHIINISSRAGALGDKNDGYMPAYRISKTALNMYTRTLAERLTSARTIVSSLDPEWVKTDMGGPDAPGLPEEAAVSIYNLAISQVETGQFWLNGHKRLW